MPESHGDLINTNLSYQLVVMLMSMRCLLTRVPNLLLISVQAYQMVIKA